MRAPHALITPVRVVAAAFLLPIAYVVIIGPERFYYESWGTWILSPVIYTRISPSPLKEWLLYGYCTSKPLTLISIALPVILFSLSAVAAFIAIHANSLRFAFLALFLTSGLFGVYHFLQPLGITFIAF